MSTPITIRLDASALKESACILRFYNKVVLGLRGAKNNNDMEYGSAFHIFKEVLHKTGSSEKAMAVGLKYYKESDCFIKPNKKYLTNGHLLNTFEKYIEKFGVNREKDNFEALVHNGLPLIEQTFSIPYYQDEHIQVFLQGTIDDIGKMRGGCYAIGDEKTTTAKDVKSYFRQYLLSPQLMFYRLAITELARMYPGSLFEQMERTRVGCFINGVFLSPTEDTQFIRSDVMFFSEYQMTEFVAGLRSIIQELSYYVSLGKRPPRQGMVNGACQKAFGECEFYGACSSPDEASMQAILNGWFKRRAYEPLNFRKQQETQKQNDNNETKMQ